VRATVAVIVLSNRLRLGSVNIHYGLYSLCLTAGDCRLLNFVTVMWTGGSASFHGDNSAASDDDPRIPYWQQMVSTEVCAASCRTVQQSIRGHCLMSPVHRTAVQIHNAPLQVSRDSLCVQLSCVCVALQDAFAAAFGPMPMASAVTGAAPRGPAYSYC
jgi:hypothetical protein